MTEWIWFNGEVMPLADARVGVEDRGFQFADGVYEVMRLYDGRPFALSEHLDRLDRSANAIELSVPMPRAALSGEIEKLIAKSALRDGMVYLQLTRGAAPRNHTFGQTKPTLLFYARQLPPLPAPGSAAGVKLISVRDDRWKRCWIKAIALLPNVLAKNVALAAGADEAVFVDDGIVTECSISNFFAIVGGKLITHPAGPKVLGGVTRQWVIDIAATLGIDVIERPPREDEAMRADELFITSTTREIGWVGRWNDRKIAERCGAVTLKLHQALRKCIDRHDAALQKASL